MGVCWVGSLAANLSLVSVYLVSVLVRESRNHLSKGQKSGASPQVPMTNPPITGCLQAPVDNFYIGIMASIICEVRLLLIQGVVDDADQIQTIVIIATLVRVITALRSHCKDSPQRSFVRHIVHS